MELAVESGTLKRYNGWIEKPWANVPWNIKSGREYG